MAQEARELRHDAANQDKGLGDLKTPRKELQLTSVIRAAIEEHASDIHLNAGRRPTLRINGDLRELNTVPLAPEDTLRIFRGNAPAYAQQQIETNGAVDFAFSYGEKLRFRADAYKEIFGQGESSIGMALRLLPGRIMTLDEIRLPFGARDMLEAPRGLFLVTGPTGSGKTTTLAAIMNAIITAPSGARVVTLEQPIEYRLPQAPQSVVSQREVGVHVPSFTEGLKQALRQDPDVIMVGEMRDLETIEVALRAAETGHLVLGTLHTIGGPETIDRIVEQFHDTAQNQIRTSLAESLWGVVSQALLPKKDGGGMVAVFEFMRKNGAIANLIREKKTFKIPDIILTGGLGMQRFDDCLYNSCIEGLINDADAVKIAKDKDALKKRLSALRSL